ncbi:MAG: hypothetical protein ACI8XO_004079 [Verrucomicrobiales bacterium]|jgi:hypothetical protein
MANPFQSSSTSRKTKDRVGTVVMAMLTYTVLLLALLLFG